MLKSIVRRLAVDGLEDAIQLRMRFSEHVEGGWRGARECMFVVQVRQDGTAARKSEERGKRKRERPPAGNMQ